MGWWKASLVLPISVLCLLNSIGFICGVKYLVTFPKALHYNTEIIATITAVGVPSGSTDRIRLEYRGARDGSRLLNHTDLAFDSDGMQTWRVTFPWERMQILRESEVKFSINNEYIYKEKKLTFQKDTGYIFIQTDKPIYTPRQTVRFRIIAVDEQQALAKYQLKVDIKNPDHIVLDRMRYSAEEAFKGQEFVLPKEAKQGLWYISANFEGPENAASSTKTVKFEVKEYVLPRFSANLNISTSVITQDTEWISLEVNSKYVYGRPVIGSAEMQLGVWDPTDGVQMLPVKYSGEFEDGKFYKDIRISHVLPRGANFPRDKRLYVAVNVTEAATGENDTIIDTSTFIAHPFYDVDFGASDLFFKPGFMFTMKADIRAKSGRKASWVQLYNRIIFRNQIGRTIRRVREYHTLDDTARYTKEVLVPEEAHTMTIQLLIMDTALSTVTRYPHQVSKYQSLTNEYMHISLTTPIQKRQDGNLLLRYSQPDPNVVDLDEQHDTDITIQVVSRGHVVFTKSTVKNTDGRSNIRLPRRLYREVSPSMRIVAYYHARLGALSEFVVDSLNVDTNDVCLEDIYISKPGGLFASNVPYKPKDSYEMQVRGGPNMKVGFVAVDEAVFLLNNKQTLTRESFFDQVGSHDQGVGTGDGSNIDEILNNSGLDHLLFDSEERVNTHTVSYDRVHEEYPVSSSSLFGSRGVFDTISNRFRTNGIATGMIVPEEAPPQTVRNYFPESWLFEEKTLPESGRMTMNLTLPDSITTWNFLAVGLSANRGVCVSTPLRQEVQKPFFVDIRLPYKATRLEEVKVKIAIFNYKDYDIEVHVVVSGPAGLCFSANAERGSTQQSHSFSLTVASRGVASSVVKVIPLKNGDLPIRVDLQTPSDRDIVERNLYVVAEGLKVRKSITFVLDPEAKHVAYRAGTEEVVFGNAAAMIENVFDINQKMQNTIIDLALPEEVIQGTEFCHISAFGDLMGDIITHAIVESKSLVDQPVADAEEVLGDLGPTVHALLYINTTGLGTEVIAEKGRRFITHSVARLLKYHDISFFKLTTKSKPATWLTAVVLKTLCHASRLAFVDMDQLSTLGFKWLKRQAVDDWGMHNAIFEEKDLRLSKNSSDYNYLLSAEVLTAFLECDEGREGENQVFVEAIYTYLISNRYMIEDPMVLAKVVYALWLYSPDSYQWEPVADRLWAKHKSNELGQIYWSNEDTDVDITTPFWYKPGAKASSIEATAYALMVLMEYDPTINVDSIADWLVAQRNDKGAFISAMDSMAAIQALSKYSLRKHHGSGIDLSCNVSSDKPTTDYTHSFKFTLQNATRQGSINNVPVGHKLEVLTQGQGLGQMQVNVEYNVPVDRNARCPYNISVDVRGTNIRWSEDMNSNPLCTTCGIGCPEENNEEGDFGAFSGLFDRMSVSRDTFDSSAQDLSSNSPFNRAGRRRNSVHTTSRRRRSLRNLPTASKRAICLHVCLENINEDGETGVTTVEFEMLTGYLPVASDVERIRDQPEVRNVEYIESREVLVVQFNEIPYNSRQCFGLRATDEMEVGRPTPATVTVKLAGEAQPSCFTEYNPPPGEESLQVFCADASNSNRGECRCFSGICSSCMPLPLSSSSISYNEVVQMTCRSPVVYGLELNNVQDQNHWVTIDATVLSLNRTGSHELRQGETIKMITPSSCYCPHFSFQPSSETGNTSNENHDVYLLTPDVEKLVDRRGDNVYRYLLDEKSVFLRVSPPLNRQQSSSGDSEDSHPTVPFMYLQSAVNSGYDNC